MHDQPSARVIRAVARANEVDPTELPQLYEAIDPDALDALVTRRTRGPVPEQRPLEVRFTYAGRDVVVRGNGDLHVQGPASESDPAPPE